MENNEIMTNEEVMETTEEIVKVSSANGFKKAAAFGLVFIAGYVAGKYIYRSGCSAYQSPEAEQEDGRAGV